MTAADLTPAERDILERLLTGQHQKQVAAARATPLHAVRQQVDILKRKAGVRTLLQLGYWAALHGIHPVNSAAGGQG